MMADGINRFAREAEALYNKEYSATHILQCRILYVKIGFTQGGTVSHV